MKELKKYNQEHLIKYLDELGEEEKNNLINQIKIIDFNLVDELFKSNVEHHYETIESIKSYYVKEKYSSIGKESVLNGEYAYVTMAGGEGSRLGFNGPKGAYTLEHGVNKSLFNLLCDKLHNIYIETNVYVNWYIMTSYNNHDLTVKHFKDNNYFNYPKDKIIFFKQGMLPVTDFNGKIIMDKKHNIKMGGDGSGGIFKAMYKENILDHMKKTNVKWVFISGVDNTLTPVDNFELLGFTIKEQFKISSLTTHKAHPDEKVGVFAKLNGKPGVIEYIHLTEEMNNLKDDKGNLVYKDSHILLNLFSLDVLYEIGNKPLPFYKAIKKNNYIDENGNTIVPNEENSIKYESFIFDAFTYVDEIGLLNGTREEIFAPIKNKEGESSPKTSAKLYKNFYNIED